MICPSCNTKNNLTWKKYFASPLGHHICEHCQAKFRFQHSIKYSAAITGLWIACGLIPSIICHKFGASLEQTFVIFWLLLWRFWIWIGFKSDSNPIRLIATHINKIWKTPSHGFGIISEFSDYSEIHVIPELFRTISVLMETMQIDRNAYRDRLINEI